MASKRPKNQRTRQRIVEELHREMALERFQSEKPQMWLQSQRVAKLVDIQERLPEESFPEGTCFLHGNTVGMHTFAVKRISGIDLDTCQVTIEIYGDEELEKGVVVLPLESIEWFGFPSKAVPIGVHFEGFTKTHPRSITELTESEKDEKGDKVATKPAKKPRAAIEELVRGR
jgi:hypothetical protein